MGRPAKAIKAQSSNLTKEEIESRTKIEEDLKGDNDKIKPNENLNERQIEIFDYIVNELKSSNILGNLDVFILNQTAISVERLEKIDTMMNMGFEFYKDNDLRKTKEMYMKLFFRCCNELCLSPQSRAKISISATPKENKKKTLADILGDDDD